MLFICQLIIAGGLNLTSAYLAFRSTSGFSSLYQGERSKSIYYTAIYITTNACCMAFAWKNADSNEDRLFLINSIVTISFFTLTAVATILCGMMIEIDLKAKPRGVWLFIISAAQMVFALTFVKNNYLTLVMLGGASVFSSIALTILVTVQLHIDKNKENWSDGTENASFSDRKSLVERSQKYYDIYERDFLAA